MPRHAIPGRTPASPRQLKRIQPLISKREDAKARSSEVVPAPAPSARNA